MANVPFLELKGISKQFPGVKALDHVDLKVSLGEVLGLVGENGAGKSTIIKIIMGIYSKDEGQMFINGEEVNIHDVIDAGNHGLAAVYQELSMAPDLSVAENFFMGQLPRKKNRLVDWAKVYSETSSLLKELDVDVDPKKKISKLSPAMQEMVTIAKTVYKKSKLLIFDEPTALLSNEEVVVLFRTIQKLKEAGIAIIYISHRLEEIFKVCDSVTILKDGKLVKTLPVKETNQDQLISLMVGRSLSDMYNIKHFPQGKEVLRVEHLKEGKKIRDTSFTVYAGEIFGLFGLVGSGRTELVRGIYGADKLDSGDIYVNGEKVRISSPKQAIEHGIGLLPEDRKHQGVALSLSVNHNVNIASYAKISKYGIVDKKRESGRTDDMVQKIEIKTPTIYQLVGNLSGGNQQKVIIGKWLCGESSLFIFDEPTVGIDVGAKQEIYKLIEGLVSHGQAVIIISSYLPEVMGLSDRIGVLHEGTFKKIIDRKDFSEETLLRYASGLDA